MSGEYLQKGEDMDRLLCGNVCIGCIGFITKYCGYYIWICVLMFGSITEG